MLAVLVLDPKADVSACHFGARTEAVLAVLVIDQRIDVITVCFVPRPKGRRHC